MKTKPRLVVSNANPLAALEKLAGWWRGAAHARIQFAKQAALRGDDKEMDEHLRVASDYERRVRAAGEIA